MSLAKQHFSKQGCPQEGVYAALFASLASVGWPSPSSPNSLVSSLRNLSIWPLLFNWSSSGTFLLPTKGMGAFDRPIAANVFNTIYDRTEGLIVVRAMVSRNLISCIKNICSIIYIMLLGCPSGLHW